MNLQINQQVGSPQSSVGKIADCRLRTVDFYMNTYPDRLRSSCQVLVYELSFKPDRCCATCQDLFSIFFFVTLFLFNCFPAVAQQEVIDRCGGSHFIIPLAITDNDADGIDDNLEQLLLETFMPSFINFDDEGCPGPATDGTGDTNLVVCRIFPVPQQYTLQPDSVQLDPLPVVADTGLRTGLTWYDNLIVVYGALLYGKDCGITFHTADIEGFMFTLKYTGPDAEVGWRYDTVMNNWMGVTIQTISHEGTLCEKTETGPYKSILFPNGYDTIFGSPDKHGNYLTIAECNSGFLCDPDCNGIQIKKNVKIINAGEQNAPLVADLGNYYIGYAGEDPWGDENFLASSGGGAGPIKTKLLRQLQPEIIEGEFIDSCFKICDLYNDCFNCGDSIYNICLYSCDTVTPDSSGNLSPWYRCPAPVNNVVLFDDEPDNISIFPNPGSGVFKISTNYEFNTNLRIMVYNVLGKEILKSKIINQKSKIDLSAQPSGVYFIRVNTGKAILYKKLIISL